VLLEAPFEPTRRQKNSVLLAIDLTSAVADEAIKRQDSAVVAYRKIEYIKSTYMPLLTSSNRPHYLPWSQVYYS
jgi:hypothetical protein